MKAFAGSADVAQVPSFIPEAHIQAASAEISGRFPEMDRPRLETGMRQVARFWRKEDGGIEDYKKFCGENFFVGQDRDVLVDRIEEKTEQLSGHFNALRLALSRELNEDLGPLHPIDERFAALAPDAHLQEDLFKSRIAFTVLLNLPTRSLEDCLKDGPRWTRRQWAEARLSQRFISRVPAEVEQAAAKAHVSAHKYVDGYQIRMDRVVGRDRRPMFRDGLRLISHWGLRDELRALYSDPIANLAQQRMILRIMERIIAQEIPAAVVDNPQVFWDPEENTVDGKKSLREPDARYENWLKMFQAMRLQDPYVPAFPTHVARNFGMELQIPKAEVERLLISILESEAGRETSAVVRKRLGRDLEPFDIWYDGFKARGSVAVTELDRLTAQKYPNIDAFQAGIPAILVQLGFDAETSAFLAARIETDAARGAGHAWEPRMRTEKAHLRTRVPKGGMDYQGFNTAMHELGHCVEQVLSLYRVDHTLLQGVPNTAFTEAFAFLFQSQSFRLLGLEGSDEKSESMQSLDAFWSAREIAGVGLVDIRVWDWLYKHPQATPAQLREAVTAMAKDVWNAYYAPIFGVKDSPVLAVYSHMISYPLYLPNYSLGYAVAAQIREYFRAHPLAAEMERMCRLGALTPNAWMNAAVGADLSAEPLLRSAREALKKIE
jgi:hypothetical protein